VLVVLVVNCWWNGQKLYWASTIQLFFDCITFIMVFVAANPLEFGVWQLVYSRFADLAFGFKEKRLIG